MRVDEHKQDVTAVPTPLEWISPGKHFKLTHGVEGAPSHKLPMLLVSAARSREQIQYGRVQVPPNSAIHISKQDGEDIYVWHDEGFEDFTVSYKPVEL